MLQVLLLILALSGAPAAASRNFTAPDPPPGPRPVTDKDVLAWSKSSGYCVDHRQEQRAVEERMKGLPEECVIEAKKQDRDGENLDQGHPRP
ncbi:MAG TPA: hypothetical protein VGM04_00080 [Sphingomicrobium sp.]|jgi:hypothetical protein